MNLETNTADIEREQIRAALLAIVGTNHGVLNPQQVLDAARDPGHRLHGYFEWNDSTAAEAYRLAQVGALIRRVRFHSVRQHAETREISITTVRGFQSRPSMRGQRGGYETIDDIFNDPDKRAELIAQVLRDLSSYRKRYAELSELQSVWLAVDEVALDLAADLSPSPDDGDTRRGAAL